MPPYAHNLAAPVMAGAPQRWPCPPPCPPPAGPRQFRPVPPQGPPPPLQAPLQPPTTADAPPAVADLADLATLRDLLACATGTTPASAPAQAAPAPCPSAEAKPRANAPGVCPTLKQTRTSSPASSEARAADDVAMSWDDARDLPKAQGAKAAVTTTAGKAPPPTHCKRPASEYSEDAEAATRKGLPYCRSSCSTAGTGVSSADKQRPQVPTAGPGTERASSPAHHTHQRPPSTRLGPGSHREGVNVGGNAARHSKRPRHATADASWAAEWSKAPRSRGEQERNRPSKRPSTADGGDRTRPDGAARRPRRHGEENAWPVRGGGCGRGRPHGGGVRVPGAPLQALEHMHRELQERVPAAATFTMAALPSDGDLFGC